MQDDKISQLTELTTPASDDLLVIVDVSDATMAVSGTDKKITKANLLTGLGGGSANTRQTYMMAGTARSATGRWYMASEVGAGTWTSATALSSNTHYMPFFCGRNITIESLGVAVGTAEASSSVRCGIYTNTGNADPYPKDLVTGSDTGVIDTSSTGFKFTSGLSISLTAGTLYWMAYIVTSTGSLALYGPTVAAGWDILGHSLDSTIPSYGYVRNWEGGTSSPLDTSAPTTATLRNSPMGAPIFKLSA